MMRVLKLASPHQVKRVKRSNQLLQCEAPKRCVKGKKIKGRGGLKSHSIIYTLGIISKKLHWTRGPDVYLSKLLCILPGERFNESFHWKRPSQFGAEIIIDFIGTRRVSFDCLIHRWLCIEAWLQQHFTCCSCAS